MYFSRLFNKLIIVLICIINLAFIILIKMGKFSIEYNETLSHLKDLATKSINYSKAKELISSIRIMLTSNNQIGNSIQTQNDKSIIPNNIDQPIESTNKEQNVHHDLSDSDINYDNKDHNYLDKAQQDLNIFCSSEKGIIIKQLISFLNKEINKLYFQFLFKEKELFTQLNNHLQLEHSYPLFNVLQLSSQMKKLNKLLTNTKEFCVYLDINMRCLNRILYQCDKKLSILCNKQSIALKYLRTKFESQNSDLIYILQFKIIDEITAITPVLLTQLTEYISLVNKTSRLSSLNATLTMSFGSDKDQKLISQCEDILNSFNKDKASQQLLLNKISNDQASIEEIIEWLNVNNKFRIQFRNYSIGIKYGFGAISTTVYFSGIRLEDEDEGIEINSLMDEELIIEKFLSHSATKEYLNYWCLNITKENRINIQLIYLHTLLYLFLFSFTYLSPLFIFSNIQQGINVKQILFLSVTYVHIGEIMSNFIFGRLLKDNKRYIVSILLSTFMMIIGFSVILIYHFIGINHNYIYLLFISRLIIGLGSGKIINRKYLITYTPRPLLKRTISKYQLVSKAGLIVGFISFGLLSFSINERIFTLYWVFDLSASIALSIYFFCCLILFTNPKAFYFSIVKGDKIILDKDQLSASHRKQISNIESSLVQNANKTLNEKNQSQQFTNINLISNTIQDLIQNEKNCFSYLNKVYVSLSLILFFNAILHSVFILFVILSLGVFSKEKDDRYFFSLIGLFVSIPVGYLIPIMLTYINKQWLHIKHWSNRIGLLILVILQSFVAVLIVIDEYLIRKNVIKASWVKSSMNILIILYSLPVNYLVEQKCNCLLIKIIPQSYNIGKFNVSLVLTIISSIGRMIILVIYALKTTDVLDDFFRLLIPSFYIAPLIISCFFFRSLKLKAIGRIVKKHIYHY